MKLYFLHFLRSTPSPQSRLQLHNPQSYSNWWLYFLLLMLLLALCFSSERHDSAAALRKAAVVLMRMELRNNALSVVSAVT